jgi:peptide/nickel transport system permease protein
MAVWSRFLAGRVIALAATLLVASMVIFLALSLAPGDPAVLLSGTNRPSPAVLASIRHEYHLDDPIWQRYGSWLSDVLHGDLGRSMVFDNDVSHIISGRITTTAFLVAYAGILIIGLGASSGLLAALRGGVTRSAISVGTTIAMGAPTFVVAVGLIWLFSTQLTWFPVYGSGSGFADRLWHLTLPACALALSYVAYVSRITRTAVTAELRSEHVDTAYSRGLPRSAVIGRHVLRNAAAPILTVSGVTVASLIAASVVAEQAFGLDGLGSLLVQSAAEQDVAVVQVVALIIVTAFVVINTIVDVVNAALDPRFVLGAKASA